MKITITYVTETHAVVSIDGDAAFKMQRRSRSKNLLGFWDLLYVSTIGDLIVDTDQYRHDLVDRCHRALCKGRYNYQCTQIDYTANKAQWEQSLSKEFGVPIVSEYAEYEGMAVFRQQIQHGSVGVL